MSNEPSIKISAKQLLWYTKGKNWDYSIMCRPASPARAGWLKPFELIFNNIEPTREPQFIRGLIHWERLGDPSESHFAAVAFLDPERCDKDLRPIKQFFIIFSSNDITHSIGGDWYLQILKRMKDAYEAVFSLQAHELEPDQPFTTIFSEKTLLDRFREKLPEDFIIENIGSEKSKYISRELYLDPPKDQSPLSKKQNQLAIGTGLAIVLLVAIGLLKRHSDHTGSGAGSPDLTGNSRSNVGLGVLPLGQSTSTPQIERTSVSSAAPSGPIVDMGTDAGNQLPDTGKRLGGRVDMPPLAPLNEKPKHLIADHSATSLPKNKSNK